jgi:single-strand DNA-binding protein
MASFNKVILLGNITRDPELKYAQSGTTVCNFGMAVSEKYKDKETTSFFDLVAFGKVAEIIEQYTQKGSPLFIEGKLKQESWEDKQTGQKRSKVVIVVESVQLLGSRSDRQQTQQTQQPTRTSEAPKTQANDTFYGNVDEEIPF